MNHTRLPLPLELTKPVLLAGELNTLLRAGFGSSKYDPKTQLCGATFADTQSNVESTSIVELVSIDVQLDFAIDDNEIFL